jgi:hypothetical protein
MPPGVSIGICGCYGKTGNTPTRRSYRGPAMLLSVVEGFRGDHFLRLRSDWRLR